MYQFILLIILILEMIQVLIPINKSNAATFNGEGGYFYVGYKYKNEYANTYTEVKRKVNVKVYNVGYGTNHGGQYSISVDSSENWTGIAVVPADPVHPTKGNYSLRDSSDKLETKDAYYNHIMNLKVTYTPPAMQHSTYNSIYYSPTELGKDEDNKTRKGRINFDNYDQFNNGETTKNNYEGTYTKPEATSFNVQINISRTGDYDGNLKGGKHSTLLNVYTPNEHTVILDRNYDDKDETKLGQFIQIYAHGYVNNKSYGEDAGTQTAVTKVGIPTRTGYTFGGYYTKRAGQGVQVVDANGNIHTNISNAGNYKYFKKNSINSSTTIYAYWIPNKYTITLDRQGGSGGTGSVIEEYGVSYTPSTVSNPSRSGYVFGGYYQGTNGTGYCFSDTNGNIKQSNTFYTSNATVYAKWIPVYNVVYNGNGHTEGSTSGSQHTYGVEKALTPNGFGRNYLITYKHDNNTADSQEAVQSIFNSWNTRADGTGTRYNDRQNVLNLMSTPGTFNLYAQWQLRSITLPRYNGAKNGYIFKGWKEGNTEYNVGQVFNNISSNRTFTATWTLVCRSINGKVKWVDNNNKYKSRKNVEVYLTRNPTTGLVKNYPGDYRIEPNQDNVSDYNYSFSNIQSIDTSNGTQYAYTVNQRYVENGGIRDTIPGYKTTYTENRTSRSGVNGNVLNDVNITNTLIVPTYNASINYTPVDTFNNQYLKNGKVKITGNVINTNDNTYPELGLWRARVEFAIDKDISLDNSTLKVQYMNQNNTIEELSSSIENNIITVVFGVRVGENVEISKIKEGLKIEIVGTVNEIKDYSSTIKLTGFLRDYAGENTNIDLGEVVKATNGFKVQYQMPKASIRLTKRDSITNKKITNVEFTLYEWNGSEYVAKEILRDTDEDGYYESSKYEWNKTSQGKYKIEETTVQKPYKNNGFKMEFTIHELKTEDYIVVPEYGETEYKVEYKSEPDGLDREAGVIENEPYKIKMKLHNIDSETKKEINSNAVYKIYQWNSTNSTYEEYISYLSGNKVAIKRGEDKTYLVEEWLYYTDTNEGKYRVIEETASYGYYGDYEENTKDKRVYDINILEIIEKGKYDEQEIGNEGIIEIYNASSKKIENERVKGEINVQVVDIQNNKNVAQGDATLQGAEYGLYAKEQINHADGITSRYEGEPGVLYKKDEFVMKGITDETGKFKLDNVEMGKYYLKQIKANEGYIEDKGQYDIELEYQGQEIKKIIKNQLIFLRVKTQAFQMIKLHIDYDNEANPLPGAGFKIYKISELSIVKERKIIKNENGTYTLNDFEANRDESLLKKANKDGTYKLGYLIDYYYKISNKSEGMNQIPRGENEYYPYSLEGEIEATYYTEEGNKQNVGELYSDEDGYIRSPELAYGEYIIIETTVPDNYEAANPFEMKVNSDSREAQKIKYVYDPNFEARIKLHLIDVDTRKEILKQGAKFVIENVDTEELVTYKDGKTEVGTYEDPYEITREDGIFITPIPLRVGRYVIRELEAPDGYVVRGQEGHTENGELKKEALADVEFEIGTNQMYYVDDYYEDNISVIIEENAEQVSTIELNVKGESLEKINKIKEELGGRYKRINEEEIEPIYSIINLEGVKVGLYAKEDIYTQDNQKTIRHEKGKLVREGITNERGIVYFENVEIGKYYIKEIDTIEGYMPTEPVIDVECKYNINRTQENKELKENSKEWKEEAQKTPVVMLKANILKDRQKVKVNVESKDIEEKAIWGTIYGIYAKEDIQNYNGEVVISAGELLKVEETDEEGKETFNIDLPLGMYYVKEIKPQQGYLSNKAEQEVNALFNLAEGNVLKRTVSFINDYIKVRIYVVDKDTKEEITGATLKITSLEGNGLIDEIKSKEGGVGIIKMPVGKYYLEEVEVPKEEGYVTTRKIEFEVKEVEEEQEVIFEQDYTKITFRVINQEEKEIEEGEFIIQNEKGEKVARFVLNSEAIETDEKNNQEATEKIRQIITRLPIGKYTIESVKLPEQYKKISSEFEIVDTQGVQVYTLKTEHGIFDLGVQKWANKIILIEDGMQKVRLTEIDPNINPEKIMRVDLNKKRIENTIIKFVYTIRVTNKGEIAGYVKEIKDKIPEGLELAVGENKDWKEEENGIVTTKALADKELKPGESAEVEIVLKWKNSGENIGVKENIAEIVKAENKYGIEEKGEGNEGKSIVALGIVTGKEEIRVWVTGGILFISVISLGVILIKRYVI